MKFNQLNKEAQNKANETINSFLQSGALSFNELGEFISFDKEGRVETFLIGEVEYPITFVNDLPDLSFLSTELIMLCNLYEVSKLAKVSPEVINNITSNLNIIIRKSQEGAVIDSKSLTGLLKALNTKTRNVFKS